MKLFKTLLIYSTSQKSSYSDFFSSCNHKLQCISFWFYLAGKSSQYQYTKECVIYILNAAQVLPKQIKKKV